MITHRENPFSKFANSHYVFGIVASLTARHKIFNDISNAVFHSINSVMNISASVIVRFICLIGRTSTIETGLRCYISNLFLAYLPIVSSTYCIVHSLFIESIERRLSKWHTFSTRLSSSFPKTMTPNKNGSFAITSTNPPCFNGLLSAWLYVYRIFSMLYNKKFSVSVSNLVYAIITKASTTFSVSRHQSMRTDNRKIPAVAFTFPHGFSIMVLRFFQDQKFSKSLSSQINALVHNTTLKGAPRMEIGSVVHAVRPIGARVKREIRFANCMNGSIIS